MNTGKSLARLVASPLKVARILEWQRLESSETGSILSLCISDTRIDLSVGSDPSRAAQALPSIALTTAVVDSKRILAPSVVEELRYVMSDYSVCALIVNWPVQEDGWCGAPCGRVLYTLDQLCLTSILSASRPICLWDANHNNFEEDEWGRSPVYSQVCKKQVHIASVEQYMAPSTAPADVWNDFCRAHWPQLYREASPQCDVDLDVPDHFEDSASYLNVAI